MFGLKQGYDVMSEIRLAIPEMMIERTWRCIFLQISVTFAKMVFLFPSLWIEGGAMVYRFEEAERSAGFAAWREA